MPDTTKQLTMPNVEPKLTLPKQRVAEHQSEYLPVTVALAAYPGYACDRAYTDPADLTRHLFNTVVMAFRPTPEQREAIARGEDIYVAMLTFGRTQQPISVLAGKDDAAALFHVAVQRDGGTPE